MMQFGCNLANLQNIKVSIFDTDYNAIFAYFSSLQQYYTKTFGFLLLKGFEKVVCHSLASGKVILLDQL